jgi:hypothetical protein
VKQFPASQIRNVALVGHQESGDHASESPPRRAPSRLGRVEDGNTTMVRPRGSGAQDLHSPGVAWCEHDGTKINLIDTPGYEDFVGDVLLALDGGSALIAIRADAGVEVGTDRVRGFVHVGLLSSPAWTMPISARWTARALRPQRAPIQLPIGSGDHSAASSMWWK